MARSGVQPARTAVSWTFEPTGGLEPPTARLQVGCATNCATPAGHGNKSRDKDRDNAPRKRRGDTRGLPPPPGGRRGGLAPSPGGVFGGGPEPREKKPGPG